MENNFKYLGKYWTILDKIGKFIGKYLKILENIFSIFFGANIFHIFQYFPIFFCKKKYWPILANIGQYWPILANIGQYWPIFFFAKKYWKILENMENICSKKNRKYIFQYFQIFSNKFSNFV